MDKWHYRAGRREMFPSEIVILMAIAVNKDAGKKLLTRPTDVIGEYIGYLYDSLVKRGYLRANGARGHQLTPMGRKALLEFLHKNETMVKDTRKRLQQLGIEVSQEQEKKIDKLEKETIKAT
jgi:hypothetical protein